MLNKYLVKILVLLLLAGWGAGCFLPEKQELANSNVRSSQVKLVYSDSDNEHFVTEERQITFHPNDDQYSLVLQELIKGSQHPDYRSNIASNTIVYGTMKQDTDLIVNLSTEFCSFGGSVAEIIAVGSVVNTMTGFDPDIQRVKILVEGEDLIGPSGNPRGFMEPFQDNIVQPEEKQDITLYFCNQDASALETETRTITVAQDISIRELMLITLQELIKGPISGSLHKTIPSEVRVNQLQIKDNLAAVDFSVEMHTQHWGGSTGESMTINSIVYTLTEFPGIDKVMMTVDGSPISIEHGPIEEPVSRS